MNSSQLNDMSSRLVVGLVLGVLTGCAGPSPEGPPPAGKLSIVQLTPERGAKGVSPTSGVTVQFSHAVEVGSVALALQPAVAAGEPTLSAGDTIATFGTMNLAPNAQYAVTVTARGAAGEVLEEGAFSFETGALPDRTAPSIVSS